MPGVSGIHNRHPFLLRRGNMPTILWDLGTGYDLFSSLYVLHHPATFGVRLSWAAGVRFRLPIPLRGFLETAFSFLPVPLAWLYRLPEGCKDAAGVIEALAGLPPADRLETLLGSTDISRNALPIWKRIQQRHDWDAADLEALREIWETNQAAIWPGMFHAMASAWAQPEIFGEQIVASLRAYCQLFFFEEEGRIRPVIEASLERYRGMAQDLTFDELIKTTLHTVHFDQRNMDLVLVPSFWAGPLIFFSKISTDRYLVLFGSRPETIPLIPGELVPSDMLAALKAIADPTRLRILRYLAEQPLTLSEMARRLRLRPPTILHHLYSLRQADLIEVSFQENSERRYALRQNAIEATTTALKNFLIANSSKDSPDSKIE